MTSGGVMDAKRIRRRAFWIGVRSVFDLSGRRTMRDVRQLAADATPPPMAWPWVPPVADGVTVTGFPPGTCVTYNQ